MEASGSVEAIAEYLTERLGTKRAMLAIVLAGEFVTYGGVSLFVAFFVLEPMGHALFKVANIPQRLMAAAIALGKKTPASVNRRSCCPGRTWVRRPPSPVAECSPTTGTVTSKDGSRHAQPHMPNLSLQPNFELDMNMAALIANKHDKIG
jgi:hypothetical protein